MVGAERLLPVQLGRLEKSLPIETGGLFGEIGRTPYLPGSGPVVAFLARRVGTGDLHFEIVDTLRAGGGVADLGSREHGLDVGAIGGLMRLHVGRGGQVILAL